MNDSAAEQSIAEVCVVIPQDIDERVCGNVAGPILIVSISRRDGNLVSLLKERQ